ncbi:MAG: TRAP transporter large permease [Dethiobacteria bacterium]|jgi:tripartite ATP-independent transporter DctM subunit
MAVAGIMFSILILLLLLGLPVAISLGVISSAWVYMAGRSLQMIASRVYAGIDSFVLMAIPFFVLAGEIMNSSGITDRIIRFVNLIVGRVRGGLAQANIYASVVFAGITGAAISDVSALGSVFIPAMEKQGYTRKFSAMITAASSIVGPIIPPSIITVIYGAVTGTSIGALFSASFIPGFLLAIGMSVLVAATGKKRNFPKVETKFSFKELALTFKDTFLALLMPLIIIGGILGGIFTPTEAAAVAVFYALVVGILIFRSITVKDIYRALSNSVRTSAMLFFIIGVAAILGWIIARINLPVIMAEFFLSLSDNPNVIFLLVILLLLFVGTWLETGASCIILAPILAPMMEMLGFHPVHFGTVMIVALNIGLITPPLGVCLFAVVSVGKVRFEDVVSEIWPYIAMDVVVVLILVFIPELTLFLPRLFGFI